MDIILSVNNREEIMTIPVIPSSYTVQKPQGGETFETVSGKELNLLGLPKLKSLSFESFFPIRDYPYLRDRSMKGWEYVYKIDTWILQKLPIRLIITDTPINMAVSIENFEYSIKTDGDLWYNIEFKEFDLLEDMVSNNGNVEDIDMEELEKLKSQVEMMNMVVSELANPMIYNYIDENMPEWAHEAVGFYANQGIISGTGEGLGLTYGDLKSIVWNYNAMVKAGHIKDGQFVTGVVSDGNG